jgi:lipase
LLRTQDADAYTQICGVSDRWRAHVRAGRWYEAFEEVVDFYNGPGSFARWPPPRRQAFLAAQQARGDRQRPTSQPSRAMQPPIS